MTESLETTRAEKRKLETQIRELEADKTALQEKLDAAAHNALQSSSTAAPPAADAGELQDLRDQISDLEEELADAQKREQKTRAQLLEVRVLPLHSLSGRLTDDSARSQELSTVQGEVSSLKTQLRQAQRKLGTKA